MQAQVELDALPGKRYSGKVVRLSPAFDPVTRTLDAEVHIQNPGELRPGMYGRGSITTTVHKDAVVVPAGAVQISNDKSYVFVLEGKGGAHAVRLRPIVVGEAGGREVEVRSGLAEGELIVAEGAYFLQDGQVVRVLE